MEQRVSLITLGARDLDRLAAFYESLGWSRVETPAGVIAFDLIGQTIGLFGLEDLAQDMGVPVDSLGHGAMTLAHNLDTPQAVDDLMQRAENAGARIVKPAVKSFWGGYHGYFADPEGHVWEIAHNPLSPLGPENQFRWNGYGD